MDTQLSMLIDLFRFHLERMVKCRILASGMYSYLSKQKDIIIKFRLIPSLLSLIFAGIFRISLWSGLELSYAIKLFGAKEHLTPNLHVWLLSTVVAFTLSTIGINTLILPRLSISESLYNNN